MIKHEIYNKMVFPRQISMREKKKVKNKFDDQDIFALLFLYISLYLYVYHKNVIKLF